MPAKKGPDPLHVQHKLKEEAIFEVLTSGYDHPVPGTAGKQHVTFSKGDSIKCDMNLEAMYPNKFRRLDTPANKKREVQSLPTAKDADPKLKKLAERSRENAGVAIVTDKPPTKEELDAAAASESARVTAEEEAGEELAEKEALGDEVTDKFKKLIGDLPYQVYLNGDRYSIVNTKKHKVFVRKSTVKVKEFFKNKK